MKSSERLNKNRGASQAAVLAAVLLIIALAVGLILPFGSVGVSDAASERRALYLIKTEYDEENGIVYAYVGFSGEESTRLLPEATLKSESIKENAWFYINKADYTYPYAELYGAASDMIMQMGSLPDNAQYSELKIVAVYDTIYKKLKSNGEITAIGKYRSHKLELNSENSTLSVQRVIPNTANWYTLLASLGLILIAAATAAALAIKGIGKWKRIKE